MPKYLAILAVSFVLLACGDDRVIGPREEDVPPPSGLTASALSSTAMDLSWMAGSSSSAAVTAIALERRLGSESDARFAEIARVSAPFVRYTDQNLQASTQYCYRVRAFAGERASAYSAIACATTRESPLPTGPVTLGILGRGIVLERYTAEVAVHGTWAYTTTWGNRGGTAVGNAVKIWNVSGATPQLVDSLIISGAVTTGDVQISDDGRLLVVATEFAPGSIVIFDRSTNPARPTQLARFNTPATNPGVHTVKLGRVNNVLYAFLSADRASGQPSQLVVADLSDPANPREILVKPLGLPFIHDVFVRDGLLFTAEWDNGFSIWDIGGGGRGGTPVNPILISNGRTVDLNVHNLWWFHDPQSGSKRYLFVGEEGPAAIGSSSSGDIHVVDIGDMTNPREVAFYRVTGAGTHNFWMDEASGILYAAYYNGGVRALDVRGDLGACTAQQKAPDGRCDLTLMGREAGRGFQDMQVYIWGVQHSGTHVYASDMLSGLFKLDAAQLKR